MTGASHNLVLVMASISVSVVAAFTGLAMTNNIAALPAPRRKIMVVMSAFILGGGIWSMHFIAMLAHQFPVAVYYDTLQTLGSVLIAILVVGTALLMLHFSTRTAGRLITAGLLLGAGIIVMHYVGMLAIRGVKPHFSALSILLAVLVAAIMGVLAIRVAYGRRSRQNIIYGAVVFGFAVVTVHYSAMLGTSYLEVDSVRPVPVAIDNHTLAMTVAIAAFVICGAFLLATTSFLTQTAVPQSVEGPAAETKLPGTPMQPSTESLPIPFEKNKKINYLDSAAIGAVRADGHYTHLYTKDGVFFCPWSITEAEKKLSEHNFHRTHRSYLVNIDAVDNFEKRRETGVCLFKGFSQLSSVPVSRNRIMALSSVLEHRKTPPAVSAD